MDLSSLLHTQGTTDVKTPQAFYDFTLQFHQDLDLVYPEWAAESSTVRHKIYDSFRQRYGAQAVRDLDAFIGRILADVGVDLETLWLHESKADWVLSDQGIRRLLVDFQDWAASL
jgi:hypothetical protein